jgi:anthraniloyl-CoA monooxygenase
MKINVLGGGPAGLYSALLLKKSHADWDITVHERNPRGATYGWGVVFSDRTLTSLREADYPTFTEITESFVLWEAIDVHYRGQLLRCDGHAFAGIGRRHLLDILQRRGEQLGVRYRYEHEVDTAAELDACDLLIAADGVNSRTREAHLDTFQPRTSEGATRYIWFGTNKVYDSFTFLFRDTEHGLFQVHAYPFDATTSTFIVECREEVWRRAGLDEADEAASVAFCEALFRDHLGPHRLFSNHSRWLTFVTLKCRRWSRGNTVLLGDAAHTAHFSIGSGTKLALEDAIGLAQAFEEFEQIPAALRHYELARRPRVEATQRAAVESQGYFEHVSRYQHFEPQQFVFHLLTRSGRIGYDNLKQRDPYFVAAVDRWFAARAEADKASALIAPPAMFTPLRVGTTTLPNRAVFVSTPTYEAIDGVPGTETAEHLLRLARGGAGMVITEPVAVALDGRISPLDPGIYTPDQQTAWESIVASIHQESTANIALLLNHSGRRGATRPRTDGLDRPLRDSDWPLLAPSPIPYTPANQTPREMDPDDIHCVQDAFTSAAHAAAAAGCDVLILDMSRGYLLGSFLSPLTNQRADDYGGSFERRLCFPLDVLRAVRTVWPGDLPLAVALTASDRARGGIRPAEAVSIAHALAEAGATMFVVHAGQTVPTSNPDYGPELLAGYSDLIRNATGVPTLSSIVEHLMAETEVEAGQVRILRRGTREQQHVTQSAAALQEEAWRKDPWDENWLAAVFERKAQRSSGGKVLFINPTEDKLSAPAPEEEEEGSRQ